MQRQRLLEEFNLFSQTTLAPGVSSQQRRDMRIAFMCGASAMYKVVLRDLESTTIITQNDIDRIKDLVAELQAFDKQWREGLI